MKQVGYALQRISKIMELIQDQIPYIPMCLEWLEVKLNAVIGCYFTMILDVFFIFFQAISDMNTMILNIHYSEDKDQKHIDVVVAIVRYIKKRKRG